MGRANVFEQHLHRDHGHLVDWQRYCRERRPEQGKPVRIAEADQRQVIRHAYVALGERLERAHHQFVARGNEGRRLRPAVKQAPRQAGAELHDAGRVDGCSRWQTFWHIDLPLAAAGMAASGIFAFLTSWNEFQLASLLTSTTAAKTFPVGLFDFTSEFTVDWRGMCAMSVVMLIPAVVVVVVVQRNLIRGLTSGAVK